MHHYVTAFLDGSVEVTATEWTSQKVSNIPPPLPPLLTFKNWDQWKQHLNDRLLKPLRIQQFCMDSNVLPWERPMLEAMLELLEFEDIRPDPLLM